MARSFVVATRNQGKLNEIRALLADCDLVIRSLADYADLPEIIEDGETFAANARIKAVVVSRRVPGLILGEDSGLEVDALSGRPGVYSARYAGARATDAMNNQRLLEELASVPLDRRQARYRCVAVLAEAGHILVMASGVCGGTIADQPRGSNGFGYDPLFFLPQYRQTFGQVDPSLKAAISHRAMALRKIHDVLRFDILR